MIEEIRSDLYRIEIPLPGSPLRALNSYLIKSPGRFLLIDTGWNREECLSAMSQSLQELGVDLGQVDFFITHMHSDHLGMMPRLAADTAKVYISRADADTIRSEVEDGERHWGYLEELYRSNGFPEDQLKRAWASHPGRRFGPQRLVSFRTVEDGDTIDIGDYSLRCVETPGHTPGHTCLYEPDKKIFFSGDHILDDITPNITYWRRMADPLKQYLQSLDRVYPLDVNLVLPGHRRIIRDHQKRIRELRSHHRDRLNEVISALEQGEKSVYQVAPYIKWDIECPSWELFPAGQKWFAFGETLAHLLYLEGAGSVKQRTDDHRVVFSLV